MARRVALLLCFVATVGCGAPPNEGEAEAEAESAVVSGRPDDRPIAGTLTRAVSFTATPGGSDVYCTLPAGEVTVARFEAGHYRVYRKDRKPCDRTKPDSFRGWVAADAVEIKDAAYFGKLKRVEPGPTIDVRMSYAGSDIFCTDGRCLIDAPLYGMDRCYVHPRMLAAVTSAATRIAATRAGAKLAMLDCYRPVYVQYRMASLVRDPVWVAQPSPPRFGGHNGGIAVDVSVVDADDHLIDMGSGYDEFTPRSKYATTGIDDAAKANRKALRDAMTAAGLKPYDNEWWHFSLDIDAEPLDLAL